MKKAIALLSLVFLGATAISFAGEPTCKTECENLQLEDITFIEIEEEIVLDFDTAQYLPEGFDPYRGMDSFLDNIVVIEEEEEINLGFDTAKYLPEGFNPYEGMIFDIDDIIYIEDEEEIILNSVTQYL